jgi:hypothetical protein
VGEAAGWSWAPARGAEHSASMHAPAAAYAKNRFIIDLLA